MKTSLLSLFSLMAMGLSAQISVYQIDSLNTGNLSGQDGWQTTLSGTTTDIQVAATYSHNGKKAIRFNKNGAGVNASYNRPIDSIFPGFDFSDTTAIYYLYADIKREYWGAELGIGYDANNDGKINMASSSTEKALRFKFAASNNGGTTLYNLNGQSQSYPQIGGGWTRIELKFDLGALGGQGLMSLRHKPVTASVWDTLFINKPMGLVYVNNDKKNPNTWDQFFGHFTGSASGLDHIELWKIIPNNPPSALSLSNDTILENLPVGSFVSNFVTVDADTADTHTYSFIAGVGDTNNADFTISGDSLLTNSVFDYETKEVYHIRVKVEDQKGGTLEETLVVYIGNENEIGIAENYLKGIEIYPNPVADQLTIVNGNTLRGKVKMVMFSMNGQLVMSDEKQADATIILDVSTLPTGEYILHISDENGEKRQARVMVN